MFVFTTFFLREKRKWRKARIRGGGAEDARIREHIAAPVPPLMYLPDCSTDCDNINLYPKRSASIKPPVSKKKGITSAALVFHARRACTLFEIEISHSVFPTQNMYTFFHRYKESTIHLLSTARTPCTRSIKVHPIQDVSCQALRFKALGGVRGGLSRKSSTSASSERSPERFPSVLAYPRVTRPLRCTCPRTPRPRGRRSRA